MAEKVKKWTSRVVNAMQKNDPRYDLTHANDWIGIRDYCDTVTGGMWHADELDALTDAVCARIGISKVSTERTYGDDCVPGVKGK